MAAQQTQHAYRTVLQTRVLTVTTGLSRKAQRSATISSSNDTTNDGAPDHRSPSRLLG
jgi:hypothetical protein